VGRREVGQSKRTILETFEEGVNPRDAVIRNPEVRREDAPHDDFLLVEDLPGEELVPVHDL